jgi:hypothetical protein
MSLKQVTYTARALFNQYAAESSGGPFKAKASIFFQPVRCAALCFNLVLARLYSAYLNLPYNLYCVLCIRQRSTERTRIPTMGLPQ